MTSVDEPVRYPATFGEWCRLACKRSVVKRGLKFAVVVGAILIAINHGDDIWNRTLEPSNYVKMALTVVVPYMVSVFSSVGAMIEHRMNGAVAASDDGVAEGDVLRAS